MFIIAVSVVFGVILCWIYNRRKNEHLRRFKPFPAPPGYPVIGNVKEFIFAPRTKRIPLIRAYFATYGPVISLYTATTNTIQSSNVEFAQFMLSSTNFINKGYFYDFFKPWIGYGLITSRGEKWRQQRKMLHPAFHYSILNDLGDIVRCRSTILVEKLEAELNSEGFDIIPYMYACTLDTIAESAMNVKLNSQQGCSIEYTESVQRITALIAERVTNPLWHPNFIHRFTNNYRHQQQCLKVLHNVSSSIVEQKVAERQEKISDPETNEKSSNEKKKSLIEILLDLSDPVTGSLSMDNVKEQVDTFMFGGQDTVAISMSWTLILVGQHPDVQKKIVEELNEVFGDSDRLAENNDLAELKYLECVYKEALRLYPPIAFINRQISEDVIVGDYFVPAGTDLALHIHQLHRSPEHFANPNKFDPSHFFLENAKNRHPYAYVPFSAGPRNCIGQKFAMTEAKILLAQIFRHFEIETLYKMEDTVEILDLMLHPESRPHIKIKKRIS